MPRDLGPLEFEVPTLMLHGEDERIVPIGAADLRSSKLVRNATVAGTRRLRQLSLDAGSTPGGRGAGDGGKGHLVLFVSFRSC